MASAPEQSEEQSRAEEKLEGALRACAANLLRVIAGAGRPYDLPSQMAEAALAFEAMCDVGAGPRAFDVIKTTLNVSHAAHLELLKHPKAVRDAWSANGEMQREHARDRLRTAGVRLAAAGLDGDATQRSKAEQELHQGVSDYREAMQRIRSR